MADNVIPFPGHEISVKDGRTQSPDSEDTISFTREAMRPLTAAYPALPRRGSGFEHIPWTDLVTRNFDGRG